MTTSKQILNIKIISCGGMIDLMSEMEATFLNTALGLFRNVKEQGRATSRATASMVRAYRAHDLYDAMSGEVDLVHLIAHAVAERPATASRKASPAQIKVGTTYVKASTLEARASKGIRLAPVVVSTACELSSADWHRTLKALGVELLIASESEVTPANLAAFDMAFYSALLSQVRRGQSTEDRVVASFKLAEKHYNAIHAVGTPYARFKLTRL